MFLLKKKSRQFKESMHLTKHTVFNLKTYRKLITLYSLNNHGLKMKSGLLKDNVNKIKLMLE